MTNSTQAWSLTGSFSLLRSVLHHVKRDTVLHIQTAQLTLWVKVLHWVCSNKDPHSAWHQRQSEVSVLGLRDASKQEIIHASWHSLGRQSTVRWWRCKVCVCMCVCGVELYLGEVSYRCYLLLRAALVEGADRFESIPGETRTTVVAALCLFSWLHCWDRQFCSHQLLFPVTAWFA